MLTFRNVAAPRFWAIVLILIINASYANGKITVKQDEKSILVSTNNYQFKILKEGFRYSILKSDNTTYLNAHENSGMMLLRTPVVSTKLISEDSDKIVLELTSTIKVKATVSVSFYDNYLKMSSAFQEKEMKGAAYFCTKGVKPAYGLSDHAAVRANPSTEVSGYFSDYFGALSDDKPTRLVSNFIISPSNNIAFLNMEPAKKILHVSPSEWAQGNVYSNGIKALYYFMGPVKQIYADYLKVRNENGYTVYKPKYEWFGIGWEAFGALGWTTNEQTMKQNIDTYLQKGFPLSWIVLGSGFWPNHEEQLKATTSFGAWDKQKYPDPERFIKYYKDKGLKVILGLRIAFMPNGIFTREGIEKGYFIKRDGQARLFRVSFPKSDCYFLDGNNPAAVNWYIDLCKKWLNSGVDGFKEDLFGYEIADFDDDKLDAVNKKLMDMGVYVMGRNGYLGSPMDIHRFEDFNYNQNQDRGPVNGLSFSYSGFPYTYPDIVGGTGLANKEFGKIDKDKLRIYLMRNARYASVNPSMSYGFGVWELEDPQVMKVCLEAAKLHYSLHPYIYSAAIDAYKTGFPHTLAPMPLAFPADKRFWYRENNKERGYQWMIGESLLATPLYGNDYDTVSTRDIYLPDGKWIDYDNGQVFQGPTELKNFALPFEKTPLFVGGKGFVVLQKEGKLIGKLYPVGYEGKITFNGKEESGNSTVTIKRANWTEPKIKDLTAGKSVSVKKMNHGFEFSLISGHHYEVN